MSEPYEPRDPNTQLYLRAKWLQEWSPIFTVVISCLALAVVGIQACIYNQQRQLMNEQKVIMDKQSQTMSGQLESMNRTLAETQKSADASVKSADASKISAEATAAMAAQNKDLIKAARTQADASLAQAKTSQVSAKAAEQSATIASQAFSYSERPDLFFKGINIRGEPTANTLVTIDLILTNPGKTAYRVRMDNNYALRDPASEEPLKHNGQAKSFPEARLGNGQEIPGKMEFDIKELNNSATAAPLIAALNNNLIQLVFYGRIRFEDGLGKRYAVPYCYLYDQKVPSKLILCSADLKGQYTTKAE